MALVLETGLRNAIADSITTHIDTSTSAVLLFETASDSTVAQIDFQDPSFGAAATGVITMAGQALSDTNAVGGLVEHFSIYLAPNKNTKVLEGTCAVGSGDIDMSSLTVGATDTVELTTFTITCPSGT